MRRVAIIGYDRTPFAKVGTNLAHLNAKDLLTHTLQSLSSKYHLKDQQIGEVVGGGVIKHSNQGNLVRESLLQTDMHPNSSAYDIQKACATGAEAAIIIANKIALGQIETGIACGVDTASDFPIVANDQFRSEFLESGQSIQDFVRQYSGDPDIFIPEIPGNDEPETGMSMGEHAELMAKHYQISREDQDAFAFESHQKLARAYENGFLDDMITPIAGLTEDNILRKKPSLEKMRSLKPAFDRESGTLTAANSTPFTDGASSVFLASEEWANKNNYPVKAWLSFCQTSGIEYIINKKNLLLAPVLAVNRMLKQADIRLDSFDFYEIHEAFAAQVLTTLKIFETDELARELGLQAAPGTVPRDRLNVNGSSLATGHPFAATGARIIATMAKLLDEKNSGRGLISICAARGNGVSLILEK